MKKETARTLMIVVGAVILVIIVCIGAAVWFFTSSINVAKADPATAQQSFAEIRERFSGITPVLELRDDEPVVTRRPPGDTTGARLALLRVIVWDGGDERLARVDLPFWLLRLKSGPIMFSERHSGRRERRLNLTVEELEQYGPTLVLDHQGRDGEQIIIWTE